MRVDQLRAAGLGKDAVRRRVAAHGLHPVYPGVYAVGHLAPTSDSRELAAVYAYGPGALLSHRPAGVRWELLRSAQRIEVTAPRGRKPHKGIILHRSRLIHEEDRALVEGIPVTSVARTLVDLADVLDERRLAAAVHEAELRRLFDLASVERVLERLPGRRGRHRLLRVLAAYRPEPAFTRSGGERCFLRICADHGLPVPQANLWIEEAEVDFYWPDARLAVEVDGGATHMTTKAFHTDRRRDRVLAGHGIQVVRATEQDLARPEQLGRELRRILARRCR